MASRRARAAAAREASESAIQCATHAFNVNGWAIQIPRDDTGSPQTTKRLNAYSPSNMQWETAAAKMEDESKVPWRSATSFTDRECSEDPGAGTISVLLVGFALRDSPPVALKKNVQQTKQKPAGVQVTTENLLESDEPPVLVVTPVSSDPKKKTDLYVLLEPNQELCTPYLVKQLKVFYLPAFRDGTTSKKERGSAWNQLVAAASASHAGTEKPSATQTTLEKASDTAKIALEPNTPLMSEVIRLANCFLVTGEASLMQELQAVLEQARKRPALPRFANNDEEFGEADGELMVKELNELGYNLKFDAVDIRLIKRELVREELHLEKQSLHPFLAEVSRQLRKEQFNYGELGNIVRRALATLESSLGSQESPVPIQSANDETVMQSSNDPTGTPKDDRDDTMIYT